VPAAPRKDARPRGQLQAPGNSRKGGDREEVEHYILFSGEGEGRSEEMPGIGEGELETEGESAALAALAPPPG